MTSLLIKSLPAEIHRRLKSAAERHQRSMTQEAILALRLGLASEPMDPNAALASLPKAFRPPKLLKDQDLTRLKRLGLE